MAIELMTAVFKRYPEGGSERLLALAIADAANADGSHVFVGVDTLARMTKQSERSVQRQLHQMLATGWLVLERKSTGRRGDVTHYRISAEWIAGGAPLPPEVVPDRRTRKKPTGDKLAPVQAAEKTGGTGDTQGLSGDTQGLSGGTAVSPNPSLPFNTQYPLPPAKAGGARGLAKRDAGSAIGFAEFWAGYPRKAAEARALRQWRALAPDDALQRRLAQAVARQRETEAWKREAGRFIPLASTWLHGQRWLDCELEQADGCQAEREWDDSRGTVEYFAAKRGLPPWDQLKQSWAEYKAAVRATLDEVAA